MRPKKRILLIDRADIHQSIIRFVLVQRGFAILSASSVYSAAEVAHNEQKPLDLLLGFAPIDKDYLTDLGTELDCPTLFVPAIDPLTGSSSPMPMVELIEHIKNATARKRGPEKGFRGGITFVPEKMLWQAQKKVLGRPVHIGYFKTATLASAAFQRDRQNSSTIQPAPSAACA